MDFEKWFAVRGVLFAGLAAIAALVSGTFYVVFDQAGRSYHAAVDRCHDAGGAWVAAGVQQWLGS